MNLFHNKYLTVSVLAFYSLILFSCSDKKTDAAQSSAKGGRSKSVKAEGFVTSTGLFETTYETGGTLLPNEEVEIHPEISGIVRAISFREGQPVKKGQTLLQLNDADIRAQIQKLQALRAQQATILKRQEELVRIGGIAKQDYETTETQIQSYDADLAYQREQLRKTKIIAPFDGTVGLRGISVGAVVTPTSAVALLQQIHPLKMDFTLPDRYHSQVKPGDVIRFSIAGSLDTLEGTVKAINPGVDVNTRTLRARAFVPNASGTLTPGSFAHVSIPLESASDAILIPSQAIIPTTRDKKVAVVQKGKAKMVTVTLGARTADQVEILQGLQAGDTILTTGLMQVKDGAAVQVTKVRS